MDSSNSTRHNGSDESTHRHSERGAVATDAEALRTGRCPERCGGRVVTEAHEAVCERCGLVVSDRTLDTRPTSVGRKCLRGGRIEWAREPTTAFRVDGGLRTKIGRGRDARGNWLSNDKTRQLRRLRRQHKRLVGRNDRVTEALRDVAGIGANLDIPGYVRVDAARLVRVAKDRRLPCGRLSWEALAGGAILLAARNRLTPACAPTPEAVARYTKATLERTCAAARKIRIGGDNRQLPPGRPHAVEVVLEHVGSAFGPGALLRVARVAQRLLDFADETGIGPGTSRVTMATVAVDRATLLLGERPFSRAELVEAAKRVVDTSESRVSGYSVELHRALEARGRGRPAHLSAWVETTLGEPNRHEVTLRHGH